MTIFEVLKAASVKAQPFRREIWPHENSVRLVDCGDEFRLMSFQVIGLKIHPILHDSVLDRLKPVELTMNDIIATDWEIQCET